MKKGAIGTLQLIVIVTVLSFALTAAILLTVHSVKNISEITVNIESGLFTKPLN